MQRLNNNVVWLDLRHPRSFIPGPFTAHITKAGPQNSSGQVSVKTLKQLKKHKERKIMLGKCDIETITISSAFLNCSKRPWF